MTTIVIPCAGNGQRFIDAGFRVPKPIISVGGTPMIDLVVENLRPKRNEYRFVFLCRPELREKMAQIGEVIEIPETTKGAACTVLNAREIIDKDEPIIIASCDQLVDFDVDNFIEKAFGLDGMLVTYKSDAEHHSFCRVEKGKVVEVAEKKVISDNANVGIYYFGSGRDFCRSAEIMIDKKDSFKDEYYIAPVYNYLTGRNIKLYEVKETDCHILGTPVEMRRYLECEKH